MLPVSFVDQLLWIFFSMDLGILKTILFLNIYIYLLNFKIIFKFILFFKLLIKIYILIDNFSLSFENNYYYIKNFSLSFENNYYYIKLE